MPRKTPEVTVRGMEFVAYDKLIPKEATHITMLSDVDTLDEQLLRNAGWKHGVPKMNTKRSIDISALVTHEIHLLGTTITAAKKVVNRPDSKICSIIWTGSAKALGRKPQTKLALVGEVLYHVLTWSDLGMKAQTKGELKRTKDYKLIYFLREAPQPHIPLIMGAIERFHTCKA